MPSFYEPYFEWYYIMVGIARKILKCGKDWQCTLIAGIQFGRWIILESGSDVLAE
jgi:hypothetical protein